MTKAHTALASELTEDVPPGDELGVLFLDGGALTDLVARARLSPFPWRGSARWPWWPDVDAVELYCTTHCDSGHLLASLASHDVLVP